MKRPIQSFIILACILPVLYVNTQTTINLYPINDVHYQTNGNGLGNKVVLKYNLSEIPPGAFLLSAYQSVLVNSVGSIWDGDLIYMNLNNQSWNDTITSDSLDAFPKSDTVWDNFFFPTITGWDTSVDLKSIVLKDYNAGRSFCSIFLKDPDDSTHLDTSGISPLNLDTLTCGNRSAISWITFWSGESVDTTLRPCLIVKYCFPSSFAIQQEGCDSLRINGQLYTSTGMYMQHLINAQGCDSTVIIDLRIHHSSSAVLVMTGCSGITINGQVYLQSGQYVQTLTNADGCDSTLNLFLNLVSVDTTIIQTGPNLTANAANATYQWVHCDSGYTLIPGDTSQIFMASSNGSYAVIITQDGCTDTSSCYKIISIATESPDAEKTIHVNPNPVNDIIIITSDRVLHQVEVSILEANGKMVKHLRNQKGKHIPVDVSVLAEGIYLIEIKEGKLKHRYKVIKI